VKKKFSIFSLERTGPGPEREKQDQGFILIHLLLFLVVCSGIILSLIRIVLQEAEIVKETIRRKQMETITQSLMQTILQQEETTAVNGGMYSLPSLMPGNTDVTIYVTVERNFSLGLRFLQIKAEDNDQNSFSLRQCRIDFPEPLVNNIMQYTLDLSGTSGQERPAEKKETITSEPDGAAFPQFSVKDIAGWASAGLPAALEMQRDGLYGGTYFSGVKVSLPKGITVHGSGIVLCTEELEIADNSIFTDRIIILADKDVHIGSHVKLEKALLLCRGKLTVGTDSTINGAVMALQHVKLGDRATITGNREVMNPYQSIISY